MKISNQDLQAFYTLLTPRIEADISSWYGIDARLVGEPTFHPRPWSYFFRYRVQTNDSKEQAILAKIRHIENMNIAAAMQDKNMREEMQEEFDSLVKIRDIFTQIEDAARFDTIRHLALYEDLNILIMEEADIITLKSRFQKPAMWMEGKARKIFETHLELTGQWLRIFHDQIGQTSEGRLFSDELYQKVQTYLRRIETTSGKDIHLLKSLLKKLYQQNRNKTAPYRISHDNFSLANVFVTGDEKICSFDPHNKPGALYIDIAKLIIDMETCLIQLSTYGMSVPPSRLESFNTAFLRGYFQNQPMNTEALNLYHLILLVEKWFENEERLNEVTGIRKLAYTLGTIPMRNYLQRLINRQMRKLEG